MTREQWLESCWRSLARELAQVRAEKDRRGGQHVPLMSSLLPLTPSGLKHLERCCRDATETTAEWYGDKEVEEP